jgi:UDP-N-acetyl-D-galactosamine dehydrogenase
MHKIGIIGLGYVGLPLAVELSKKFTVHGYDKNITRVSELKNCDDVTKEISNFELAQVIGKSFYLSNSFEILNSCTIYIVTVPTPVTDEKYPDLNPLQLACETISKVIKKGDVIFFESTVYPGCTEEFCIPIIENLSHLKLNIDFEVGYSPERINPGDKNHTLTSIKKIISGSSEKCLEVAKLIYGSIIDAGLHVAPSIKVAEAAKVIENTQRDVNIAFMNELNSIFYKLNINIYDVLEAANTKWNFLPFTPGLVGGHCIGVDPYYLSFKAQAIGHNPEIILAGRRINDDAVQFYSRSILSKVVATTKIDLNKINVLILGGTFKENCPDFRNTKVIDLYHNIKLFIRGEIMLYDPLIIKNDFNNIHPNVNLIEKLPDCADIIILAVKHNEFLKINYRNLASKETIIFDLKNFLPKELNAIVL